MEHVPNYSTSRYIQVGCTSRISPGKGEISKQQNQGWEMQRTVGEKKAHRSPKWCFSWNDGIGMTKSGMQEGGSSCRVCVCVCVCVCVRVCVCVCVTPWTAVLQAPLSMGFARLRILEWVATSFSRGSSRSRDQTWISRASCTGRRILHHCTTGRCKMPFRSQGHPSSWWESSFMGRLILQTLWGGSLCTWGLDSVTRRTPLCLTCQKKGKPPGTPLRSWGCSDTRRDKVKRESPSPCRPLHTVKAPTPLKWSTSLSSSSLSTSI